MWVAAFGSRDADGPAPRVCLRCPRCLADDCYALGAGIVMYYAALCEQGVAARGVLVGNAPPEVRCYMCDSTTTADRITFCSLALHARSMFCYTFCPHCADTINTKVILHFTDAACATPGVWHYVPAALAATRDTGNEC
jgi:uncharacterized protein YlaI